MVSEPSEVRSPAYYHTQRITFLVQPMIQDLRAEGVSAPVVAIENALEAHIFEQFQEAV